MIQYKQFPLGSLGTNCYVVYDDTKQCVIVDGDGSGRPVMDFIEQEGLHVGMILLTHAHFDHMLGELQHVERIRKFSLQTNENKSVCAAHTRILEMVLHGTADELGEALESHLNRYKLSVEQARSVHPEYFTEE